MEEADLLNQSTSKTYIWLRGVSVNQKVQMTVFALFLTSYVLTLIGNILIVIIIIYDRRLHTPMYFFLCTLSLLMSATPRSLSTRCSEISAQKRSSSSLIPVSPRCSFCSSLPAPRSFSSPSCPMLGTWHLQTPVEHGSDELEIMCAAGCGPLDGWHHPLHITDLPDNQAAPLWSWWDWQLLLGCASGDQTGLHGYSHHWNPHHLQQWESQGNTAERARVEVLQTSQKWSQQSIEETMLKARLCTNLNMLLAWGRKILVSSLLKFYE